MNQIDQTIVLPSTKLTVACCTPSIKYLLPEPVETTVTVKFEQRTSVNPPYAILMIAFDASAVGN